MTEFKKSPALVPMTLLEQNGQPIDPPRKVELVLPPKSAKAFAEYLQANADKFSVSENDEEPRGT